MKEKNALVLGCGVSGLSCGIRLLENGFNVEIRASSLPPDTTSNVAAAYWYPYKVSPEDKVLGWAAFSYNVFMEMSRQPETGISAFELVKLYDHKVDEPFWKSAVKEFSRAGPQDLPEGYVDGFVALIPQIETPVYMNYIMNTFMELGGIINKLDRDIESIDEVVGESELIINCLGLGSRKVFNDENTYPIRGQLVRTTNPGLSRCINDEFGPLSVSYIVPRSKDCILGGTAEENDWNLVPDPATAEEILRKCKILEPKLNNVEILEHIVGLRPGRTEVRLEIEQLLDTTIIHNYGHGGAGFTLSWGCAEEVLELAEKHTS